MRQDTFVNAALGTLLICAATTTLLIARRELAFPRATVASPERISSWRSVARDGHRAGPPGARVRIVVFSDFQCPFCAALTQRLGIIRARHPTEVAVIYRHYPLSAHPYARRAAEASECAAHQGRFDAFHDALFAEQEGIGQLPWAQFATSAGVENIAGFEACMRADSTANIVTRDSIAGAAVGVVGTPVLLINQFRIEGARPLPFLEEYVARAEEPHS